MLFNIRVASDIFALYYILSQLGQFFFQSGRQYSQSHYLDQANIFFLNMVQLLMRVVNAQRELFCGDVISQHQIQLIHIPVLSCDRGNGIMWFSIGFGIHKSCLIGVASPRF